MARFGGRATSLAFALALWPGGPSARGPSADSLAPGPCTHVVAARGAGDTCSLASPCDLPTGLGRLAPGEVLCLRAGTYRTPLAWTEASGPRGTDEQHRVTIRAFPRETAILRPALRGERGRPAAAILFRCHTRGVPLALSGPCQYGRCSDACPRFITLGSDPADGGRLVVDARDVAGTTAGAVWVQPSWNGGDAPATGPHHIRLQGLEIENSPTHGIFWGAGDYNELLDLDVHGNGAPGPRMHLHGLYLTSMKNTVARGRYHANRDSGIHVWNGGDGREASFNTFDGVEVYGNGCSTGRAGGSACTAGDAPAVTAGTGRHNVFRNMKVHANPRGGGFWLASGAWRNAILDSAIHGNAAASGWKISGIYLGDEGYATDITTAAFEPALQAVEPLPSWIGSFETRLEGNVLRGNAAPVAWKGRTGLCEGQIFVQDTRKNPLANITDNVCSR